MSLEVILPAARSVVITPAVKATLPTTIKIERIVDIPDQKEVAVFISNLGRVVLAELSGDNYDSPHEWSNADVVTAVQTHINSLAV